MSRLTVYTSQPGAVVVKAKGRQYSAPTEGNRCSFDLADGEYVASLLVGSDYVASQQFKMPKTRSLMLAPLAAFEPQGAYP